jgi:hypothetical protein
LRGSEFAWQNAWQAWDAYPVPVGGSSRRQGAQDLVAARMGYAVCHQLDSVMNRFGES